MDHGERDGPNADSAILSGGSVVTPKKGQAGGKTTAVFKSPAPSHKKGSNGSYNHYNNASSNAGHMASIGSGLTSSQAQGTNHMPSSYILRSPMVSTRSKFFNQNNDSNSKLFGNSFAGLVGPAAA